jgi:hypothetical protein
LRAGDLVLCWVAARDRPGNLRNPERGMPCGVV